jgi:hypothetical protein
MARVAPASIDSSVDNGLGVSSQCSTQDRHCILTHFLSDSAVRLTHPHVLEVSINGRLQRSRCLDSSKNCRAISVERRTFPNVIEIAPRRPCPGSRCDFSHHTMLRPRRLNNTCQHLRAFQVQHRQSSSRHSAIRPRAPIRLSSPRLAAFGAAPRSRPSGFPGNMTHCRIPQSPSRVSVQLSVGQDCSKRSKGSISIAQTPAWFVFTVLTGGLLARAQTTTNVNLYPPAARDNACLPVPSLRLAGRSRCSVFFLLPDDVLEEQASRLVASQTQCSKFRPYCASGREDCKSSHQ